MDTIKCMQAFAAVAAQNSFTAGARQVGLSTKLASKYVKLLEQRLDTQLLNRTTRSVTLTDTGRAYYERCRSVLDQFEELEGLVQERQQELAGPIRITAPTGFGSAELIQALAPFQQRHPKVTVDLHLSDQRLNIIQGGFDVGIRFGKLEDSSLIATRLLNMRMVVIASPDYLIEHSQPEHVASLSEHNCLLQMAAVDPNHWSFRIQDEIEAITVGGSFHANSPRAIAHMAAAGLGIGRVPLYVAQPFLDQGTLQIILQDFEVPEFGLYAIYPPARHLTARIRALLDHLKTSCPDSGRVMTDA